PRPGGSPSSTRGRSSTPGAAKQPEAGSSAPARPEPPPLPRSSWYSTETRAMRLNPRTTLTPAFLLLAAALTVTGPAWAAASEKDLDKSIDLKVTEADSGEVFKTFGQILGAEVAFDPSLAGKKLTLQLEKVRLRTVLTTACESLGCQWTYSEGPPAK